MGNVVNISTPIKQEELYKLKIFDEVRISGILYTARDAAHKRLTSLIENGEELPFDIKNQMIYYVGPTPTKPDREVGAAGPTTSYRMDAYTPILLDKGLKGMIGKGLRNEEVIQSIKKNKAVYFVTLGGCAALISQKIKSAEIICYEDLGTEAVRKIYVEDFPAYVAIDTKGNSIWG